MTLYSALNIASNALGVHQAGLSIVSNNIANMNTEGYHKQKLNLGTNVIGIPIGNNVFTQVKTSIGVEAINVDRYTTSFLGSYYRDQLSDKAYLDTQAGALGDIANMFDDLGGLGLDGALQGFYDALDNLNQYPNDMAARVNLLNAASKLTDTMNSISKNLDSIGAQSVGDGDSQESLKNSDLAKSIENVNNLLEQLASVNRMLNQSNTGTLENNNLMDKRDMILNSLAEYGNFDIQFMDNGVANVKLGGVRLVTSSKVVGTLGVQTAAEYEQYCVEKGAVNKNQVTDDNGNVLVNRLCNALITITKEDGNVVQNANSKFTSGKLGAIIDGATEGKTDNIKTITGSLDTLASTIADVFNTLQMRDGAFCLGVSAGGDVILSNDNKNIPLFVSSDGSANITAGNLSINNVFFTNDGYKKIAAAYFENYDPNDATTYDLKAVGNASNVISMIKTKSDNTASTFDAIGNISLSEYYSGILGKAASLAQGALDKTNIQDAVVDSLNNKLKEETSVDLNEELADMIRYRTAYTASARVFSTCNSLLDVMINLGL